MEERGLSIILFLETQQMLGNGPDMGDYVFTKAQEFHS